MNYFKTLNNILCSSDVIATTTFLMGMSQYVGFNDHFLKAPFVSIIPGVTSGICTMMIGTFLSDKIPLQVRAVIPIICTISIIQRQLNHFKKIDSEYKPLLTIAYKSNRQSFTFKLHMFDVIMIDCSN
jgi:hypothetical protein